MISMWVLLGVVCAAGAVGGLVNGLLSSNGLFLPSVEQVDHMRILRPGFVGNVIIGIVAAGFSWGFYGPLSMTSIFSVLPVNQAPTLSAVAAAAVVGIGGARWITNEIDKRVLTVAASKAAAASASPSAAQDIATASPAGVLAIAQNM